MSRIKCRTPSTGKSINVYYANVPSSFITLVEAPDFSVPDPANTSLFQRDPSDSTRAIKPGEIFFLTPMYAKNKSGGSTSIDVKLKAEDNTNVEITTVTILSGDTVLVPLQGRSLTKRNASSSNGDMIFIKASDANTVDVWISVEEKLSSEHIGVIE
jgi:hypothetical protein